MKGVISMKKPFVHAREGMVCVANMNTLNTPNIPNTYLKAYRFLCSACSLIKLNTPNKNKHPTAYVKILNTYAAPSRVYIMVFSAVVQG